MHVTYICPRCQAMARSDIASSDTQVLCSECGQGLEMPRDAFDGERLRRCIACPSTDLFVRKDFPQRVGVAIVVLGIVASSVAWAYTYTIATFAILFATALADVVLYVFVPDALMCYRCGAIYRHAPGMEQHGAFSLETHERYRQQAARMAGPSR